MHRRKKKRAGARSSPSIRFRPMHKGNAGRTKWPGVQKTAGDPRGSVFNFGHVFFASQPGAVDNGGVAAHGARGAVRILSR